LGRPLREKVLAAVGLYGVLSYSVGQRVREIGIRMALGAGRGEVLRRTVGQGVLLLGLGASRGLGVAFALSRLLSSMLFGISPTDPGLFLAAFAALAAVAVLACYLPARRAASVDCGAEVRVRTHPGVSVGLDYTSSIMLTLRSIIHRRIFLIHKASAMWLGSC
jgi:predicted lysophospholipase L1 biosynthesis ABC-type transport system permease subunit